MSPRESASGYLEDLNPEQREAVEHMGGPLLVVAGAGSGKTRVLTYRIAHLMRQHGVSPWGILALTFTNKAATEMKERVERLVGAGARDMMVGTFHSSCARILRREIEPLGYSARFSIYDESDSLRLLAQCLDELGLDRKSYHPKALRGVISSAKNEMVDEESFAGRVEGDFFMEVASRVYRRYQERLRANDALDFDDLLCHMVTLLELYPATLERYREKFRHVLVDEYQDTNAVQYRMVRLLAGERGNLCVVGDDDQGIYSWRGADMRNILEFEKDYPEARVVKLEQNYRTTGRILSAAGRVIGNNVDRKPKTLWTSNPPGENVRYCRVPDEHAEAAFVCDQVERLGEEGIAPGGVAVFYRTHAQSRVIEEHLVRRGVSYRVFGGTRFYDRQEIKDTVAYLRLLANPRDEVSLRRIVNVPARGIGKSTLAGLDEHSRRTGRPLIDCVRSAGEVPGLSPRAVRSLGDFARMIDGLALYADGHDVDELLEEVWAETGYLADLEAQKSLEAEGRVENLKELHGAVAEFRREYGAVSLDDFLERVSLVSDTDNLEDGACVSLMTLHNAKGLEFDGVFMVGMEERVFPHARSLENSRDLEEERRLCYVGMTRARRVLYVTHAEARSLWGGLSLNRVSRFLEEVPPDLLEAVEYAPPRPEGGRDRLAVGEGDVVVHAKWGEGLVLSLVELENDCEITVEFTSVGKKRMLMSYAPLSLP